MPASADVTSRATPEPTARDWQQIADGITDAAGLAPVKVDLRDKGGAASEYKSRTVFIDKGLYTRPSEFQNWSVAHEIGHLEHPAPRLTTALRVGAKASAVLLVVSAAVSLAAQCILFFHPSWGNAPWVRTVARVAAVVAMCWLVLGAATRPVYLKRQRMLERTADAEAKAWGFPFSELVEKETEKDEMHPSGWIVLRRHDFPKDRRNDRDDTPSRRSCANDIALKSTSHP